MAVTRSRGMVINDEIKDYITNLMEPLATNDINANLFDKFKEELILNLEKRINDQNNKIEKLESNLAIRENTINILLNRLSFFLFFFLLFVLDVSHLTNEHRTQDCIAS